jgi:uncharacterized Zn-binding protein involved in type VI secretion
MSGKPAARLGDPTDCPLPGHVSNPLAAGSPDVLFDGLPAARQGDASACGGALEGDLIANVLINGRPAAVLGSVGSHGNVVVGGSGTVVIGTSYTLASFSPPAPMPASGMGQVFNEHFIVRDSSTGDPVTGRAYRLQTDSGQVVTGITDGSGKTRFISANQAEDVVLMLEPQTALVIA